MSDLTEVTLEVIASNLSLVFFFFFFFLIFIWLHWVIDTVCEISDLGCSIRTLSRGMWDLVP